MPSLVDHAKNIQIAVTELKRYREQLERTPNGSLKNQINVFLKKIEESSSFIFQNINYEAPKKPIIQQPAVQKQVLKTPAKNPAFVPKPLVRKIPVPQQIKQEPQQQVIAPQFTSARFEKLSKQQKEKYIKELNVSYQELEDFIKAEKLKQKGKLKETKTEDFTLYKPNEVGAVANKFMKKTADKLIKNHPKLFQPMFDTFLKVDMAILSRSYVATILFFSIFAFPLALGFLFLMNVAFGLNIVIVFVLAFLIALATPIAFYFYPRSLIGEKQAKIRQDLPFALVHMSAVAGSGAAPISIFELLVESDEYPELKKEIKKVLNYVNLFGYNLSNALRNVALTTPSEELKELLNGIISTIETGGDLKDYLKEKSEDALNQYRLDRKKQVEALGTFSEVYTSILIAAPLLLLVTLAIINSIGGQIGGVSVKILAYLGVAVALPLLNVGFIFFLKTQSTNY